METDYYPCSTQDLLTWAFDHDRYDENKPVMYSLEDRNRSLTRKQAKTFIRKLIAGLRKAGHKSGDCVCIAAFNDIHLPMIFNAIVGAGGVFAGTNPSYKHNELVHHLKTSEAKFLNVEPAFLESISRASQEVGIPSDHIFVLNLFGESIPTGYRSWTWLLKHGEQDWERFDDLQTAKSTPIARLFTSGTTGLPKASVMTHHNATSHHTLTRERKPLPFESRNIFALQMFHVSTIPVVHCSPWRVGHSAYIMRHFQMEPYLKAVEELKINEMALVPPHVISILSSPLLKKDTLRSVRRVTGGAAPLDAGIQRKFKVLCAPGATCTQIWGMTETFGSATLFYYPEEDDTGRIGRFIPNVEHKLIDDDGRTIKQYDVRGELCVQGPTVTPGYYKDAKANAAAFDEDGFFKTGDVVYCDSKTKLWYIVDRKKELIKVRGFQVSPPEIEGTLLSHPEIIDVAVIGVRYPPKDDEYPRAYVVVRQGSRLDADAVKRYVSERLANYKELTGGVRFIDQIPKNASGKRLKKLLKESAQKEISGWPQARL